MINSIRITAFLSVLLFASCSREPTTRETLPPENPVESTSQDVNEEKPKESSSKNSEIVFGGLLNADRAKIEKTLVGLDIDRKFEVVDYYIGGINRVTITLIPNAKDHVPFTVQGMLIGNTIEFGDPARMQEWLKADELLLKRQKTQPDFP